MLLLRENFALTEATMIDKGWEHVRRYAVLYLWLAVAFLAFARCFLVVINVSDSLPGSVFLVFRDRLPEKGDYVAFTYRGGIHFDNGTRLLKVVKGVAGDEVTRLPLDDGKTSFLINGELVGIAKPLTRTFRPLKAGPGGVIPAGQFYVAAPNPDSFDSRYQAVGWVSSDQIIGRAYRLF